MDADQDGRLSVAEICECLRRRDLKVDMGTIRRYVRRADEDEDGSLSYAEFRNLAMMFPTVGVAAIFDRATEGSHVGYYSVPKRDNDAGEDAGKRPFVVLASGGAAGLVSRTLTAPADRVKVMLQAGTSASPSGAVAQIMRQGGVRGFWTGNGTNVAKIVPESAVKFYAYETLKRAIVRDSENITVWERLLSGFLAGVAAQTSIYPMEVVKTRLAVSTPGTYRGVADCLLTAVRTRGVSSLYAGLQPSILGIIPYAGVDLAVYGTVRDAWIRRHPNATPSDLTTLCIGAFSSFCGQIIAYPLQLVRTRMQSAEGTTTMRACVRDVYATGGARGFYVGIGANFCKGIPAIAIGYVAYETFEAFFS